MILTLATTTLLQLKKVSPSFLVVPFVHLFNKKEIDYEVGVSPCSCVTKRLVVSDVISDVPIGEEETRKSSKDILTFR